MGIRLFIKRRKALLIDDIKNRKRYAAMRKKANRNWFEDMSGIIDNDVKFDIDRLMKVNRIWINGKVVGEFTFAETALLYRFLKKCVYHR